MLPRAPAFSRNVRSCERDPEGGQGSDRVAGVVAQGRGQVDRPGPAEDASEPPGSIRHQEKVNLVAPGPDISQFTGTLRKGLQL